VQSCTHHPDADRAGGGHWTPHPPEDHVTDTPSPSGEREGATPARGIVHTTREITALIPHRWPFLLVDRIVEYDPDAKRIVGEKAVTATEWFFAGHFPDLPVMPGVLQVEALAQTMAVYVAKQPGFGDRIGLFAGIDECRFRRVVQPGDVLRLEVTMEKLGSRMGRGRGVASVDGQVACEVLLSFIIPPEGALR
jgi:3-hydroxyacyl-[acyl-carrier-protein] dehydratase